VFVLCRSVRVSFVRAALSNQSQQDLEQALGIVNPNPTVSVRDALEHPKANASVS